VFAPGFVSYKDGCTRLAAASDKAYQLLVHGRWFSPGTLASSTTKTCRLDIAEILLKVALSTIKQTNKHINVRLLTINPLQRWIKTSFVSIKKKYVFDNIINNFYFFFYFCCFNATFSNISAISWRPVLVVEEAGVPDHGQATGKLYHLRCESRAPFFIIYKAGREPTPYWW
jgi:hypothetical protein